MRAFDVEANELVTSLLVRILEAMTRFQTASEIFSRLKGYLTTMRSTKGGQRMAFSYR